MFREKPAEAQEIRLSESQVDRLFSYLSLGGKAGYEFFLNTLSFYISDNWSRAGKKKAVRKLAEKIMNEKHE